ncbi:MAG: GTPase HflX [Clostridiales bacterium]|nr:GTPase HflX [Clostridiales bacterium]
MEIQVTEAERYILAAVATGDEEQAWSSLDELADLLNTAGGETVCQVVQNLRHPDRATYVGRGKALEIKELLEIHEADGIICDDELTASQIRNLSDLTEAKVIDRTALILDIFAAHATTREGKLQVEIAQQKYRYSRLRGMGEALSRLGAGIGTRGPGETRLETDRRVIQKRIKLLSDDIEALKRSRETTRKRRVSGQVPSAAIVGYTNAGKSTLLNLITGSGVLSENKLFATLDPTTRSAVLPDGQEILFTDTVGFINKLPHGLIDAFRSTLEEARYADILIHVTDASDEQAEMHQQVVYETLRELEITDKPVISVWNKADLVGDEEVFRDFAADASVRMSAKTGQGLDDLLECIGTILRRDRVYVDTVVPYKDTAVIAVIRKQGQLISEEYEEEGIHIKAYVPSSISSKYGLSRSLRDQ